jgi:hypothetical protein
MKWSADEDKNKNQIAVNRGDEGPLEVGTASKDISIFKCRDMAGNGREWTRELFAIVGSIDREVPLKRNPNDYRDRVILRGRSYVQDEPLRFVDPSMGEDRPDSLGYLQTRFDLGFRVVIEIPEKYQPK